MCGLPGVERFGGLFEIGKRLTLSVYFLVILVPLARQHDHIGSGRLRNDPGDGLTATGNEVDLACGCETRHGCHQKYEPGLRCAGCRR